MSDVLKMNPWDKTKSFKKTVLIRYKTISEFVKEYLISENKVLDVGQPSPFTQFLTDNYQLKLDNTKGDLDEKFVIPDDNYDLIIYSHTIEHQFNPLFTLLELKKVMKPGSIMIIAVPQRPKFLWTDHHFNEIDDYRMKLILERAGLKIEKQKTFVIKRGFLFHISGLRRFLRLFLNKQTMYIVKNA